MLLFVIVNVNNHPAQPSYGCCGVTATNDGKGNGGERNLQVFVIVFNEQGTDKETVELYS